MSRLVLHIGSHKTGTSSIQSALDEVAPAIRAATGLVWVPLDRRNLPPMDHGLDDPDRFRRRGSRVRRAWLDHLAAAGDHVLAVEENLSWILDGAEVDRVVATLRRTFDRIDVVAYVRRQDAHLVSHFQQASHAVHPGTVFYGSWPAALPRHAPHHDRYLDHHARLLPWVEALGQEHVRVRAFQRDRLVDGDVVADFLDLLGVPRGAVHTPSRRANTSMGKTVTKLGHLSNLLPRRRVWSVSLRRVLPDDAPLLPSRRAAEEVLARYERANERLSGLLGIDGPAFDVDLDRWPVVDDVAWRPDEVSAALHGLVRDGRRVRDRVEAAVEESALLGRSGRALRVAAGAGVLPGEHRTNVVLAGVLARLNALADADREWAAARAPASLSGGLSHWWGQ